MTLFTIFLFFTNKNVLYIISNMHAHKYTVALTLARKFAILRLCIYNLLIFNISK